MLSPTEILCGGKYGPQQSLEKRLLGAEGAENANVGGWPERGLETRDLAGWGWAEGAEEEMKEEE